MSVCERLKESERNVKTRECEKMRECMCACSGREISEYTTATLTSLQSNDGLTHPRVALAHAVTLPVALYLHRTRVHQVRAHFLESGGIVHKKCHCTILYYVFVIKSAVCTG